VSVPIPPLNLTGGAGGAAGIHGDTKSAAAFDNSDFTVNFAPSIGQTNGGGINWLYIVGALGGYWLWKKYKA
jgi:hypothetical protein